MFEILDIVSLAVIVGSALVMALKLRTELRNKSLTPSGSN
jgi:hypothetical protein